MTISYSDDQFVMYISIELLCFTPVTNIILYVNYSSIKIKEKMKFEV